MKRDNVSGYVHIRRNAPLPLYPPVHILDSSIPLVTYIPNGWPILLNQKTNKNIRISYSLKYKHSKKNSLRKNKW